MRRTLFWYACAMGALLGSAAFGGSPNSAQGQPDPPAGAQTLAVLNARGGIGSSVSPAGQLIAVENGKVTRVVTRGLRFPYQGGMAPAADGTSVVFGNESAGVWTVRLDGTGLHRLAATPPSRLGNVLGVEHVAWSVQGQVAFAVNPASDVVVAPNQDRSFGIWVLPFHGGATNGRASRRVASPAQVGVQSPASVWSLAWSRDGRRLVTSPSNLPSTVLALDVARGTTRLLVRDGGEAAVSPSSGDLAYITGGLHPGAPSSLWVAGAEGRHRRLIVSARGLILHPVWSPDGTQVAYIGGSATSVGAVGGSAIHVITVGSRIDRVVLRAGDPNQSLLQHGSFADLVWVPVRQR